MIGVDSLKNVVYHGLMSKPNFFLHSYIIKSGLGDSTEAGLIYSIIGISNVIGRIFLGVFCDLKRVNPIVIFTFGNFFLALNELYASFAITFPGTLILFFKSYSFFILLCLQVFSSFIGFFFDITNQNVL